MKLFHGLIIASSVASLEFLSSWNDQPDENAFSWIEPKSRLRREGDADDKEVLRFLDEREARATRKKGPTKKAPAKKGKKKNWLLTNGKILNKKGKWVTPSKRQNEEEIEDYNTYEVIIGENVPEEKLDHLVDEIIALRSIDKKKFYDLAASEGTQSALEKFALREYSRKKLGRKLTEEEKEQRQKIRAARRKRKQNRRLEQERRREWRKLHRNKETGDYDEYGPYKPQYTETKTKTKSKKQNRREKRQKRKESKASKKKKVTFKATTTTTPKPVVVETTEESRSPDFEDEYVYETEPAQVQTTSSTSSTSTTESTTATTSTVVTTVKPIGRERTEDLFDMFEGETFANATIDDIEYESFLEAKNEAFEWNDTTGQKTLRKYELLKLMTIYLQPEDDDSSAKWSKFSGYGCYCFQSYDNEFWKGQGLPKDDIDKSCRSLSMCYHCIQAEETCSPDVKYDFVGLEDSVTGDRVIMCLNPTGSCERNVCECDKRMAEELRRESETFNMFYDRQWALFDASTECEKQIGTPAWDACCGTYPTRFPYSTEGSRGCCGQSTYDMNFHDCCNEKITAKGMTCSAE